MKVKWIFPPADQGFPNVSQYRFYKKMPVRVSIIYPYLASSGCTQLQHCGHDVKFLDCPTMNLNYSDISSDIQDAELVVLEGRTPIIKDLWDFIKLIKHSNPRLRVAVYGDHVSWNPAETLREGADFIVKGGDFDHWITWLANRLDSKKKTPQVINKGLLSDAQLNRLPWIDRKLVPWNLYYETWRKREHFMWNMGMRGCYYHCIYCAWAETLWENKLRYRDPVDVAEESIALCDQYGDIELLDDSDLFELSPWGVKFADQLIKRGYGSPSILWSCQTHPAQVIQAHEDLRYLKRAGLRVVKLGIESGCDFSLWEMKKGSSRKLIESAINFLQEADIGVHANMMIGFPWETWENVIDSIKWIKKLDPNQAQFSLVIPYPNTELWRKAGNEDLFIQDQFDWSLYDASFPMMKMDGLSGEDVVDLYRKAWSMFYLDPKYIWRHLKTIRHWEGLVHLFRGFKSVRFGHMRAVSKKRRKK